MEKVTVYGTDWCADTGRTRRELDRLGVAYDYVNIEQDDEARKWVKKHNQGKEQKPTVKIGTEVLSVPNDEELAQTLRTAGLLR